MTEPKGRQDRSPSSDERRKADGTTPSRGKVRSSSEEKAKRRESDERKAKVPSEGKVKASSEGKIKTPSAGKVKAPSEGKVRSLGTPSEGRRPAARGAGPGSNNLLVPTLAGVALVLVAIVFLLVKGNSKDDQQVASQASQSPETVIERPTATPQAAPSSAPDTSKPADTESTPVEKAMKTVSEAENLERSGNQAQALARLDGYIARIRGTPEESYVASAREGMVQRIAKAIDPVDEAIRSKNYARAREVLASLRGTLPSALGDSLDAAAKRIDEAEAGPSVAAKPKVEDPVVSKPETDPEKPAPKDPKKNPAKDPPKPDPSADPSSPDEPDKTSKDFDVLTKVYKVQELLYADPPDFAAATKLVTELERDAPKSPLMRGARGTLAFYQNRFNDALDDLTAALEADPKDDSVRDDLACAYYYLAKYEKAREIALPAATPKEVSSKKKKFTYVTKCGRLVSLVDGPWAEKYPLAHLALEAKHPNGHYVLVTDMGLPEGALDKLEKDLTALKPEQRPAAIERFKKGHQGLQDLLVIYDAAFKSYSRIFKNVIAERDQARAKESGKTATGVAGGAAATIANRRDDAVAKVFVFEKKQDFGDFSEKIGHGRMEHAAGYYTPDWKTLFFYNDPGDKLGSGTSPKNGTIFLESLNTLLHETFHQFCHLFVEDIPPWFNEGMAEYFGNSELQRDHISPCIPQGEYSRYQELLYERRYKRLKTLRQLIGFDHSDFMVYANANYPTAWAFCYYLASTKAGRKRLSEYMKGLRAGTPQEDLNKKIFPDIDKLQEDFEAYIGTMTNASVEGD